MIFIEKPNQEPSIYVYTAKKSKLLDGTKVTKAYKETFNAIEFYSDTNNFLDNEKITTSSDPSFKVYSDKDLKNELKRIFNGKCAYCESYVLGIAPGDIEHFRPKKKVVLANNEELVPGYYWLGADWQNLLLSCGNCNRTTTQRINSSDEELTMGKLSQFPLSDESKRVRFHGESINEENNYILLINPCNESPDQHLIFDDFGEVKPAIIDGETSLKGETSIQVYGLYRASLVLQRKRCIDSLQYVILNVFENVQNLKLYENDNDKIEIIIERIERDINELYRLFSEESVYLAMKRQKLNRFITSEPKIYQTLLDVNIDLNNLITN